MKILLNPGESIQVGFAESDGEIMVAFGNHCITVETDWPDSTGRKGIIYNETFAPIEQVDDKEEF